MKEETFLKLIDRYLEGTASKKEETLVETYLEELENSPVKKRSAKEEEGLKKLVLKGIQAGMKESKGRTISLRTKWVKVAAAAAIIGFVALGGYFFSNRGSDSKQQTINSAIKDLPPGKDAAILTLPNGQTIILDSAAGTITNANGVHVINMNGLLSYEGETNADEIEYHTITTARGNQYQLELEDGTMVSLNSASSLRYPVAFKSKDRIVELTGEGYFEVVKNASKPFFVKKGGTQVEVLGTHFNVNAYEDEEALKVTLLEGSVKVKSEIGSQKSELTLKPGEQAIAKANSPLSIHHSPDIDAVLAWKNGLLLLDNTDLATIMRQISRWYDVDINYEGKITNKKFGGGISKKLPLSKIQELLKSNGIESRLDGKVLIITP